MRKAGRYSSHMRSLFLAPLLGALACASAQTPPAHVRTVEDTAPHAHGISFIENDLPGALARAQAAGKPLFIDAWAPW